jgi:hypothetical protein
MRPWRRNSARVLLTVLSIFTQDAELFDAANSLPSAAGVNFRGKLSGAQAGRHFRRKTTALGAWKTQ